MKAKEEIDKMSRKELNAKMYELLFILIVYIILVTRNSQSSSTS